MTTEYIVIETDSTETVLNNDITIVLVDTNVLQTVAVPVIETVAVPRKVIETASYISESVVALETIVLSPVIASGAQGPQGAPGTAVAQGWQGATGIQGIQGATGTGATGVSGIQGIQGIQGATGSSGIQGIQGATGVKGDTGLGFSISKTYISVAALMADTTPTGIVSGQFAIIDTGSIEDSETSKLYIWTGVAYNYISDLSGAQGITGQIGSTGIQGIHGATGLQGIQGIHGATGLQGTTGPMGYIGATGASGIQGIHGATGASGIQGIHGATGYQGATGLQGATGFSQINEATDVDKNQLSDGSLLIYDNNTSKWTTKKLLDLQSVDCGLF